MRYSTFPSLLILIIFLITQNTNLLAQHQEEKQVDSLTKLAWDLVYENRPNEALEISVEALKLASENNYIDGILECYTFLGEYYQDRGNYSKALSYYQIAINACEKHNKKNLLINYQLRIAFLYKAQDRYKIALEWNEKALKNALKNKDSLYISYALSELAITNDLMKDYNNSKINFLKSLKYLANGIGNSNDSANIYNNLGINSKKQKNYTEALKYYNLARPIILNTKDSRSIVALYDNLGSLYTQTGEYKEANKYLKMALDGSKSINIPEIEQEVYKDFYTLSKAEGKYKEALTFLEKYNSVKDSINSIRKSSQFDELQAKFDLNKKESLLAKQDSEIFVQKTITTISILLIILLLIGALILIYTNKRFRKLNEILKENNQEIQLRQEALKENNLLKNRLFSIVSHDIRSPLVSLSTLLDLFKEGVLDKEELQTYALKVNQQVQNVLQMLENLLFWASHQMEGMKFKSEPLDLHNFINDSLTALTTEAHQKHIAIYNNVNSNLEANADPNILKLIIRNIVGNAIKFTPKHGSIKLEATSNNDIVILSIIDNGIGMTKETLDRLLGNTPAQSKEGTNQEKGTGLGLMLSKQFLEDSGSEINIHSKINEGTRVDIILQHQKISIQEEQNLISLN